MGNNLANNPVIWTALVGAFFGSAFTICGGIWQSGRKRKRDGKDSFLSVIGHDEALLERQSGDNFQPFFNDSLIRIHDAVYAVKPFVSARVFLRLNAEWQNYKKQGNAERVWHSRSIHETQSKLLGAVIDHGGKFPEEWIAESLEKFRDVIG